MTTTPALTLNGWTVEHILDRYREAELAFQAWQNADVAEHGERRFAYLHALQHVNAAVMVTIVEPALERSPGLAA